MGKALIELLKQSGQRDITAHWMAHYLAELMERARTAAEPARHLAQKEAAALILELWRYRTYLPGKYPLASFDHVLCTLERLSGSAPWPSLSPRLTSEVGSEHPLVHWLNRAEAIDHAARTVIRSCLQLAIAAAAESEGKWLGPLKDLATPDDAESAVILRLVGVENEGENDDTIPNSVTPAALEALDQLRQELKVLEDGLDGVSGKMDMDEEKSPQDDKQTDDDDQDGDDVHETND